MRTNRIIFFASCLALSALYALPTNGQSVARLLQDATLRFQEGKTEEARSLYEAVVAKDSSCYEALAWLGNYYYLKGKEELTGLDRSYKELREPTRMQSARHQEALKAVYLNWYAKAETCLLKALDVRKNEHLQQLADEIERYKLRIGLITPTVKKTKGGK